MSSGCHPRRLATELMRGGLVPLKVRGFGLVAPGNERQVVEISSRGRTFHDSFTCRRTAWKVRSSESSLRSTSAIALAGVDLSLGDPSADRRVNEVQFSAHVADGTIACPAHFDDSSHKLRRGLPPLSSLSLFHPDILSGVIPHILDFWRTASNPPWLSGRRKPEKTAGLISSACNEGARGQTCSERGGVQRGPSL